MYESDADVFSVRQAGSRHGGGAEKSRRGVSQSLARSSADRAGVQLNTGEGDTSGNGRKGIFPLKKQKEKLPGYVESVSSFCFTTSFDFLLTDETSICQWRNHRTEREVHCQPC